MGGQNSFRSVQRELFCQRSGSCAPNRMSRKEYTSLPYRRDIDGLRAIAVIAVVLFHASVPGFDGGYVGVDIFFVISGYLITLLLTERTDLPAGPLLAWFYLRRARRILPALATVLVVVIPIA